MEREGSDGEREVMEREGGDGKREVMERAGGDGEREVMEHYNMCVVSWSLLYEPFRCLINHTCSVARKLTVLFVSTKWQLKITKPY